MKHIMLINPKHTTLKLKYEIIKKLDNGENINTLAATHYGVGHATIYDTGKHCRFCLKCRLC